MRKPTATILIALIAALFFTTAASAQTQSPQEVEWFARYWNNLNQDGAPVLQRSERTVDYNWGLGSPASAVNPDRFSAQWTAPVFFEAGVYRFTLTSDDGARVWLTDRYIIDSWQVRAAATDVVDVELPRGEQQIAVDYFEDSGLARISFGWQRIGDAPGEDEEDDGSLLECGPVYIVRSNDWLSKIARNCGVSVQGILALNPEIEDPHRISVGQRLNMPVGSDEQVGPLVIIAPRRGAPGSNISASIFGFAPNANLAVTLRQPGQPLLAAVAAVADDEGNAFLTIALPATTQPGDVWQVLASDGVRSTESATFTVTAPGEASATPRYNLNLRSGPSTDFAVLDTVPVGVTLPVLEMSPDGAWVRVQYDGRSGWIAAWLANISPDPDEAPRSDAQP